MVCAADLRQAKVVLEALRPRRISSICQVSIAGGTMHGSTVFDGRMCGSRRYLVINLFALRRKKEKEVLIIT